MNTVATTDDARVDRLYALLPAIHRMRDAERGFPLKALLRVIAEQVNVVEDDLTQLYENLFIETAADWAVPYIGELVGYTRPPEAEGTQSRVLVPRREIAQQIRNRRRKGALAVLEELARDVAGWPARAVEQYKLLAWTQNLDHLHLDRHRLADLRAMDALDLIDSPFDSMSHSVDVRSVDSHRTPGRHSIGGVTAFVFRLRSYSVTRTPAYCTEQAGPHCFTFSVLGQDAPLYVAPRAESDPTHIAEELELPVPIRRHALATRIDDYYGTSFAIYPEGWAGTPRDRPLTAAQLIVADLSDWHYVPPPNFIAVDPLLGRLAFPPNQPPKRGVRVSYQYGFSSDLGGGEYARALVDVPGTPQVYRVGESAPFQRVSQALAQWVADKPAHAVIEIVSSGVYVDPLAISLGDDQTLQLRAASRARVVLRLIDWQTDLPDALSVTLGARSRFSLDGLIVTGRPVQITSTDAAASACGAEVAIRHCTLVPGWGIDCDCEPSRASEPSLELVSLRARVEIEHSIVGAIRVQQDEVRRDPIGLRISDSIVDATSEERSAISASAGGWAHAQLTILRSTVFGTSELHAVALAENTIFAGCLSVARRQLGCLRFCYVSDGCRTPRRYHCEPDETLAKVKARMPDDSPARARELENERQRVTPIFNATRYGKPAYAQLATTCAPEIVRGASDESELGVFHDLFQPQREANLRARLNEYTPAGMQAEIVFAS